MAEAKARGREAVGRHADPRGGNQLMGKKRACCKAYKKKGTYCKACPRKGKRS